MIFLNQIFLYLAGANTAEAHVVFHNQIKKAKKERTESGRA